MRIMPNDLESHWMPFTSNKHFKTGHTRMMTEGKGIVYKTYQGHELIDAVSGLFCSPLGHARRKSRTLCISNFWRCRIARRFSTVIRPHSN